MHGRIVPGPALAAGLALAVACLAGPAVATDFDTPRRATQGRLSETERSPAPRIARVADPSAGDRDEEGREDEPRIVTRSPNFPALGPRGDAESPRADDDPASPRTGRLTAPGITVASSLAVVLGLFAALVWTSRRFGGRPSGRGELPADAVERLGAHSLDPRTKLVLLRCGDRVLVIAQTASGVHPVTEIADPTEASRLIARCRGENAAAFTSTLRSMEQEPAAGGFVGDGFAGGGVAGEGFAGEGAANPRHRRTLFASG